MKISGLSYLKRNTLATRRSSPYLKLCRIHRDCCLGNLVPLATVSQALLTRAQRLRSKKRLITQLLKTYVRSRVRNVTTILKISRSLRGSPGVTVLLMPTVLTRSLISTDESCWSRRRVANKRLAPGDGFRTSLSTIPSELRSKVLVFPPDQILNPKVSRAMVSNQSISRAEA